MILHNFLMGIITALTSSKGQWADAPPLKMCTHHQWTMDGCCPVRIGAPWKKTQQSTICSSPGHFPGQSPWQEKLSSDWLFSQENASLFFLQTKNTTETLETRLKLSRCIILIRNIFKNKTWNLHKTNFMYTTHVDKLVNFDNPSWYFSECMIFYGERTDWFVST